MEWEARSRQRFQPKFTEICIGNINRQTEANTLLSYFQKYGNINRSNFTSPTNGFVFINYENLSMVDECMKHRPHYLDGNELFVKRSLPIDDEHPRERFEHTRQLMIVTDTETQQFLAEVREYFSSYGEIYTCRYCNEQNFNYILVEFHDKDSVDRIILDKPHPYNGQPLDVMKFISSNVESMNKKYASNRRRIVRDVIDTKPISKKEAISESDLEKEVYRLQNSMKKLSEDFALQRQQLQDDCSEQLKSLNESTDKTRRLQNDLEQEYAALLSEYESIKRENEVLDEQYLSLELENFEITSYDEQILAEEKAKTLQLEAEYHRKLNATKSPSSPQSSNESKSS